MAEAGGIQGKVLQGTCGWSDSSIVKCGRFYPASVKSTEDRLLHYSRFFPCVECDSSNYAIPSPTTVEKWVKSVPAGFRFHFKAFGFFTRKSISMSALPHVVRDELPTSAVTRQVSITWEEMSEQLKQKLWDRYNSALLPAYQKNKLGVVIFQFHLAFYPTNENKKHILECRKFLDVRYSMAVEFRSRVWLTDQNLPKTLNWLKEHNIGLVVADELQNELYFDKNNKAADGKGEGSSRGGVVPIVMALGTRDFAYIRVHRRVGKHRILDDDEIKSWGERLRSPGIQNAIQGPIYFMWGTDHEDQPIVNSKNLSKEIGTLAYDWKSKIPNTGLLRFCSKVSEERRVTERSASTDEKSKQADKVNTASGQDSEDSRTETTVSPLRSEGLDTRTNEADYFSSPTSQNSGVGRSMGACIDQQRGEKASLVSANKRSSSSALISPKKKKTSFSKEKSSTSGGQKTISHFFKK